MAIRTILSIDGGGIRGILPAKILANIEHVSGASASDLFDIIAGTSTGGILALGLVAPTAQGDGPAYAATSLVDLYEREGPRIFSRSAFHALEALGNLNGPKYPADGVEAVLQEYFGKRLLSQARASVMVTAYDLERRAPFFFRSWRAKRTPTSHDFPMWEVARSTSAAPTYFPPSPVRSDKDLYGLVDGGVFANNPTLCAYVDALSLGKPDDTWLVVSVGTGNPDRRIPYSSARGWGLAAWAHPLIDILIDGVSDTVDYQMRLLLSRGGQDGAYFRFQTDVPDVNQELDDTRPDTIQTLKVVADRFIENNETVIAKAVKALVAARAQRTTSWMGAEGLETSGRPKAS